MKKIIKILIEFPVDIWQLFITYLPGEIGFMLRYIFWKKRLKFLGKSVIIDIGVYFQNPKFISIDDNCWIDRNVIILAGPPGSGRITFLKNNPEFKGKVGEVYVGKNTHIAPNCVLSGIGGLYIGQNCGIASNSAIYSFSHHYRNLVNKEDIWQYSFTPLARLDQQAMILSPVVIGDFCAVGLNSVLLPGALLKKGTWISSGAVISKRYPEQTLVFYDKYLNEKSLGNLKIKE
jgi:acetyltransferase-like isoleucine patch superfamily enzyme